MFASLISLALLYLAALIIPGPNLLLLTHTAASSSRRAALGVAFGIATGTFMWVAVAVFGVQKIFDAVPALQTGLHAVGGMYLLYLAFSLFRSMWADRKAALDTSEVVVTPADEAEQRSYFRKGLLTNLTNPKSLAFWTSVAVVSLDPNAALATRIAAVTMVGMMGLVWHIGLAYLFSTPPAQRAYMRAKPVLSLITGAVTRNTGKFVATGVN